MNLFVMNVPFRSWRFGLLLGLTLLSFHLFVSPTQASDLHRAAAGGDVNRAMAYLEAHPNEINLKDASGSTALHEAVRNGHREVADMLIAAGANVNQPNSSGLTPLKLALGYQRKELADLLRKHGGTEVAAAPKAPATVSVPGTAPARPPAPAARATPAPARAAAPVPTNVPLREVARPLPTVAPVTVPQPPPTAARPPEITPVTYPIHTAVRAADMGALQQLLTRWPELIESTDEKGHTPLHLAVLSNQVQVADFLVKRKAKLDAPNKVGQLPLHSAVSRKNATMVEWLLKNRADVNARNGIDETALMVAARSADVRMMELLLKQKASIEPRDKTGTTALLLCAFAGDRPGAELLLRHGADPNVKDKNPGLAPLHYAAGRGDLALIQALLARKANVNIADAQGETPLSYALESGSTQAAALLRQKGGRTAQAPALNPTEQSLVTAFRKMDSTLQQGSVAERRKAALAFLPTRSEIDLLFPQQKAQAWKVIEQMSAEIREAIKEIPKGAGTDAEVWRIVPQAPSVVARTMQKQGLLRPTVPVYSLRVSKAGATQVTGDYAQVNGRWVPLPPLEAIMAAR